MDAAGEHDLLDRRDGFERLNPIDDVLDLGIEILHAETEPSEPEPVHGLKVVELRRVRVGLEPELVGLGDGGAR